MTTQSSGFKDWAGSYWTHENWTTKSSRTVNNWVSERSEKFEYKNLTGLDKLANITNINAKFHHLIGVIANTTTAVQEFFLTLVMIPVNLVIKPIVFVVTWMYCVKH